MQLDELMEDVPREKAAVVYDYERSGDTAASSRALEGLAQLDYTQLLEFERVGELLGYGRRTRSTTQCNRAAIASSRGFPACPTR